MPVERLECGFTLCIECNDESPALVLPIYSHKTAPDIQIIKNPHKNYEAVRQADRANRRAR